MLKINDANILRAGIYSGFIGLFAGLVLGSYGGWEPLYRLSTSSFGSVLIAIFFSTTLAYIYSTWFADFLPGSTLIRGSLFGILVWIIFLILGGFFGFFKDSVYPQDSGQVLFISLLTQIIWGASLSLFLESKP